MTDDLLVLLHHFGRGLLGLRLVERDGSTQPIQLGLVGQVRADALRAYVDDRVNLASGTIPEVPVMRGRVIRLRAPSGTRLHLDDGLWPSDERLKDGADMTVRARPGALRVVT